MADLKVYCIKYCLPINIQKSVSRSTTPFSNITTLSSNIPTLLLATTVTSEGWVPIVRLHQNASWCSCQAFRGPDTQSKNWAPSSFAQNQTTSASSSNWSEHSASERFCREHSEWNCKEAALRTASPFHSFHLSCESCNHDHAAGVREWHRTCVVSGWVGKDEKARTVDGRLGCNEVANGACCKSSGGFALSDRQWWL